ncbi:VCBS repeat-containing protein [Tolypothrix sp. PCC 7910]|uniref:FG-GAP repeat domain-containing protein n=1 Tax=Tolypothrix sp. PCC 7910 TaxID=2099387 RepID=UPI00142776A8|nr:VCBS repeat-containing protein [Tolypothrix sp. PCC 7910]QIR36614.1 VCBS repeat-containing protein [Tolypothrix sp. PCC 7910]
MLNSNNSSGSSLDTSNLAQQSFLKSYQLTTYLQNSDPLSTGSFVGRSSLQAQDTTTPTIPTIKLPLAGSNPNPNPYLTSAAIAPDFNGDGKTDKVWVDQTTGELKVRLMNGSTTLAEASNKDNGNVKGTLGAIQLTPTTISKIGDFNGDGKTDLLLRDQATGINQIMLMNGVDAPTVVALDKVDPAWTPLIGDFNGDRKTDIFWRNAKTGENAIWTVDATNKEKPITSATVIDTVDTTWTPTMVDFDGNGKTDIFWRNTAGQNSAWFMDGTTATKQAVDTVDPNWTFSVADFNGDYKTDLLWRNNQTGENVIWETNSVLPNNVFFSGKALKTLDLNWQSSIGDFNGDGKTDIFWHNNATGENTSWLMDSTTVSKETFLTATPTTSKASFGDFNGDGKTDIYWRDYAGGADQVWTTNGDGTTVTATPIADQDKLSPIKLGADGNPILGADGKPISQWITF